MYCIVGVLFAADFSLALFVLKPFTAGADVNAGAVVNAVGFH